MEQSLDNILNGTEPEPVAEAAAETPPAEAPVEASQDRPRDEHGRFVSKGDDEPAQPPEVVAEPSAPPAPSDSEPTTAPIAALTDERKKRQNAEAERDDLRRQLAQFQQPQPQQQPAPEMDEYDQQVVSHAGTVAEQRAVQAVQQHLVRVSAEAAKTRHADYLDTVPVFQRLAEENPGLLTKMVQQADPAEFAYQTVKQHEKVSQYGSIDEMLAAEKAKWEAEALEKLKANLAPAQSTPPTLSTERNVGTRSGPEWSGPKPLSELLQ